MPAIPRHAPLVVAAAFLVAASVVLRGWNAAAAPLWLDEAYSLYAAEQGWRFLWQMVPRYETHPPFYYSLLRLWIGIVGSGVGAVRALGMVAVAGAVVMTMVAAREAGRFAGLDRRGLLWLTLAAGVLAALSPALSEMAREVRPYPVMILVYATAIAALLRVANRAAAGKPIAGRSLALFFAAQAVMLWLHNLGLFYGAALSLALALLVLRRGIARRDWIVLALGHGAVALLYLPALAILVDQAPTWIKTTWLTFSWAALPRRLAQIYASPAPWAMRLTAVTALVALVVLGRNRRRARLAAGLAILAWLPVLLSVAVSATLAPVFIPRIMTALAVPMVVVLAFAAVAPGWSRWLGAALIAALAWTALARDLRIATAPPRQDWYGAVAWLAPRLAPGDEIWTYPNEGALPLSYALRDRGVQAVVRPIPTAVPSIDVGGWYPTGSRGVVSLPRPRLRAIAGAGDRLPTIWLLRLGANAYDVGDVFLDELARTRRPVGRWRRGPIDLIGLQRTDKPAPQP